MAEDHIKAIMYSPLESQMKKLLKLDLSYRQKRPEPITNLLKCYTSISAILYKCLKVED